MGEDVEIRVNPTGTLPATTPDQDAGDRLTGLCISMITPLLLFISVWRADAVPPRPHPLPRRALLLLRRVAGAGATPAAPRSSARCVLRRVAGRRDDRRAVGGGGGGRAGARQSWSGRQRARAAARARRRARRAPRRRTPAARRRRRGEAARAVPVAVRPEDGVGQALAKQAQDHLAAK